MKKRGQLSSHSAVLTLHSETEHKNLFNTVLHALINSRIKMTAADNNYLSGKIHKENEIYCNITPKEQRILVAAVTIL